jgi:hypothetical protein
MNSQEWCYAVSPWPWTSTISRTLGGNLWITDSTVLEAAGHMKTSGMVLRMCLQFMGPLPKSGSFVDNFFKGKVRMMNASLALGWES